MIPEKMKAVVLTGVGQAGVYEYPVPAFGENEVLVEMRSSSICTIDQRPYAGTTKGIFPRVGGHEGAGVVAAVGSKVKEFKPGDKVAIGRIHCGVCPNCLRGIGHCIHGPNFSKPDVPPDIEHPMNLMGCFSQYVVRTPQSLHKVAENVPFEHAAVVEPLSDVVHSIKKSRLTAGETCVILGAGIMGILTAQVAKSYGARVILSEPDAARRENAKKAGADIIVDPAACELRDVVMEATDNIGAEVVFYIMPSTKLFDEYYELLAPAGRIMMYANQVPDEPYPIKLGRLHTLEREIIGTVSSTDADFYYALQLMKFGRVDMSLGIHKTYAISDCKAAFDDAIRPDTYRCVINMQEE